MRFATSVFVDAFQGSGVPLDGDPVTSFYNVPLLALRTATVVNDCKPLVRDIVRMRFIASNCGEKPIEIGLPRSVAMSRNLEISVDDLATLLPGESLEYSTFRAWDAPGEYQLTLTYFARCHGKPLARLEYPKVTIRVQPAEGQSFMRGIWRPLIANKTASR
jgi:hypothetical protein